PPPADTAAASRAPGAAAPASRRPPPSKPAAASVAEPTPARAIRRRSRSGAARVVIEQFAPAVHLLQRLARRERIDVERAQFRAETVGRGSVPRIVVRIDTRRADRSRRLERIRGRRRE